MWFAQLSDYRRFFSWPFIAFFSVFFFLILCFKSIIIILIVIFWVFLGKYLTVKTCAAAAIELKIFTPIVYSQIDFLVSIFLVVVGVLAIFETQSCMFYS